MAVTPGFSVRGGSAAGGTGGRGGWGCSVYGTGVLWACESIYLYSRVPAGKLEELDEAVPVGDEVDLFEVEVRLVCVNCAQQRPQRRAR